MTRAAPRVDGDEVLELTRKLEDAERALQARERTMAVLMDRVLERQRTQASAFASLEQNAALQRVVERKTLELEEQNRRLETAYAALESAQDELLQRQKLESVGRLASGIAHEINTPVQFVTDSVTFVRDGVVEMLALIDRLLDLHRSLAQGADAKEASGAVAAAVEAADLSYLVEHLPPALERSVDGLRRVADIVRSIKDFAHPDPRDMAAVDLNRAVQSTLTVALNEYKYVADIETSFGEIPPVVCHGGEVNQVILNLVVNAAHAIADVMKVTQRRGRITVSTALEGTDVVIRISDTGHGIPEAIRHKVFEPFFTTMEVGRGTGQGLAIARNVVVQKHGGSLTHEAAARGGTTFVVRLPVAGPPRHDRPGDP